MHTRIKRFGVFTAAALAAVFTYGLGAHAQTARLTYAIRGATVHTATGATIDNGTIVMRDGLIAAVGVNVPVPDDAIAIDASNMNVYPGLIDMSNTNAVDEPPAPTLPQEAPAGRGTPARGGGGGGGFGRGGGGSSMTWADQEREKRLNVLRPDVRADEHVRTGGQEMQQIASAGVTTVLAVPSSGIFRGQSALVNVMAPEEGPEISAVAGDRHGVVVLKAPVAEHIAFSAGRGGGGGYPARCSA